MAYIGKKTLTFDGTFDDMHDLGNGMYGVKITEDIVDLSAVSRILLQTPVLMMEFIATPENSRVEDAGDGTCIMYCQYMDMEFPAIITTEYGPPFPNGKGTYVMGFNTEMVCGWISHLELAHIYPLPSEFLAFDYFNNYAEYLDHLSNRKYDPPTTET